MTIQIAEELKDKSKINIMSQLKKKNKSNLLKIFLQEVLTLQLNLMVEASHLGNSLKQKNQTKCVFLKLEIGVFLALVEMMILFTGLIGSKNLLSISVASFIWVSECLSTSKA